MPQREATVVNALRKSRVDQGAVSIRRARDLPHVEPQTSNLRRVRSLDDGWPTRTKQVMCSSLLLSPV